MKVLIWNFYFILFPITQSHRAERQLRAMTPAYCRASFILSKDLFIITFIRTYRRCKVTFFRMNVQFSGPVYRHICKLDKTNSRL